MDVWETVAGTGHRPGVGRTRLPDGTDQWARQQARTMLLRLIDNHGTRKIVSGMSRGWDMWLAAEAIRAGLPVEPHIPFPQQAAKWSTEDQHAYHWLLDRCLPPVFYGRGYDVRFYHLRDAGMIKAAHAVAALHDPARKSGGTWETLQKVPAGMPVIRLDPVARSVTWPVPVRPVDVQELLF